MLSRRAFLKLGFLSLASIAAKPLGHIQPEVPPEAVGWGRVAAQSIYIYQEPSLRSTRVAKLKRDTLLPILDELRSPDGPRQNPLWYRVDGGFVHSGRIQRVDGHHTNPTLAHLPEKRLLGEVTVPFTQSYWERQPGVWQPLYRLYYQSVHWITGIEHDAQDRTWYRLTDERLLINYFVPAAHIKPIFYNELAPIHDDVPPNEKLIRVSISQQKLTALEGKKIVLQVSISSGIPDDGELDSEKDVPTDTPIGSFRVSTKFPVRHMGDGYITSDLDAYELPGVPWNMYFHMWGYALHGTYWHNNFGTRMSRGCVNLRPEHALWLFRWTDPPYQPGQWYTTGRGTLVQIQE